jgi:dolichyl-phosphate-mannose-protein mannosyltransferase
VPARGRTPSTAGVRAGWSPHIERLAVVALLAIHAALALWGAARSSLTFDERQHLAAGVMIVSRGELRISAVNPPLVKAWCALPVVATGAVPPSPEALAGGEQYRVGESFMRRNAPRYHRLLVAARSMTVFLSLALALVVWRYARRLCGRAGGLLALAFYAFAPEALAHAGLVTMDLATGLGWIATVYAWHGFMRSGRRGWWWASAGALAFSFLVRFTALLLVPVLIALTALMLARGRVRRPARLLPGLALLAVTTLVALNLGYLGRTSLEPIGRWRFDSPTFQSLQRAVPGLRLPLPDAWVAGLDRQMVESEPGKTPAYLMGRQLARAPWYYFPSALLAKWPLGFLAALVARAFVHRRRNRLVRDGMLLVPALVLLLVGMFVANLAIGIRYLFPILPFLCVWLGGLAVRRPARVMSTSASRAVGRPAHPRAGWLAHTGIVLALTQAVESSAASPWHLSFFNGLVGGPGGGDRIVNDSNVDWGQGLIALREELARRGIGRIHLAYHGTADPAIYGIDYLPYLGGTPGPESDWLAVSSYYFVGLPQRMMTPQGQTDFVRIDFRPLWSVAPAARPAHCMYLFRVR